MRFGQIVGSSSRLHGKLIFLQKCGFTIAPVVGARAPPRDSLGLPFRALRSDSPLSVPDVAFRLASKAHLGVKFPLGSARSGALGCADWLPRRILASNVPFAVTLWRRSVVACAIFGQQASKDDSGIEQSASEQLSSARRLCEAL